jgi:hypothetical protein
MAKIVDLKRYRSQVLEARGFGPWKQRFGETYGEKTILADVTEQTLLTLAQPGDESTAAYYELIMGILDLGPATKFHYLPNDERMLVVDTHLFLADQVRFEMMRRLGWVAHYVTQNLPLASLVLDFKRLKAETLERPPQLSASHPKSYGFQSLSSREKHVLIRRLLPEALEAFHARRKQ